MTARERFLAVFNFQPTDRPWRFEALGFWRETLSRWRREGLPGWIRRDEAAFLYFGYDRWAPIIMGNHANPNLFPLFERKLLSSQAGHQTWQNEFGGLEEVHASGQSAIPKATKAPVASMDDLEKLLPRMDPNTSGRLSNWMARAVLLAAPTFQYPLGMIFCGLFGTARHLLTLEGYMMAIHDDPGLVHAIGEAWEKLVVGMAKRMARYRPVWVDFWEDMSYKNGMLISPAAYREFILPYFKRALSALYDTGVSCSLVDSDGDVTELIPLLQEVGIKAMMPFEVQAGMDILRIRERHPKLVIFSGLDKRLMSQGREAMEEEIQRKVGPLLKIGGYVPGLDHAVPPDWSLEDFRWFLRRLRG